MQNVLASASRSGASGTPGTSDDRLVSGWQRKHDAIAGAALVLFARDGYERTSVDAIAAEAGVSKRTVYSHYGDKENLFLLVLRETYDTMRDRVRDIVDRNLRDVDDLRAALTACIREIVPPKEARLATQKPTASSPAASPSSCAPMPLPLRLNPWKRRQRPNDQAPPLGAPQQPPVDASHVTTSPHRPLTPR